LLALALPAVAAAGPITYADVMLDFHDSGAGPIAGPYGGTIGGGPGVLIPVSTNVVLGSEPGPTGFTDFLSLPTGSSVTVGFQGQGVVNGAGADLFIAETGPGGERANVYVSTDGVNFVLLGLATDDVTTAFDLAPLGLGGPVVAVKVVGLDLGGSSPGFDLLNVGASTTSLVPAATPEPLSAVVFGGLIVGGMVAVRRRMKGA